VNWPGLYPAKKKKKKKKKKCPRRAKGLPPGQRVGRKVRKTKKGV
jgi:hypothetical protein